MQCAEVLQIQAGYTRAKRITKHYAKSFYFASLFLSKEKRNACYSIYAICRLSDEATDKDSSLIELSAAKRNIDLAFSDEPLNTNILYAFRKTINTYSIPRHYFDKLIDGMYLDFCQHRYKDFKELEQYSYLVASTVGLMMLKICGYKDVAAQEHAVKLGIAMQLTNILRDIREDYARGRIYLPLDEIASFGVTEDDIAKAQLSENFKALMRFQIKRARGFYADSLPGIAMITDPNSRFVIRLIKELYCGILEKIEENNYDVFSKRAYVGLWRKITSALKAYRMSKINAD